MAAETSVRLIVWKAGARLELVASVGEILRDVLLRNEVSPYSRMNERLNCGGRGLCATCGVFCLSGDPEPRHWHDRLARAFQYPRLSCQIVLTEDLEVEIPKKWIWGKRRPTS
jgi:ferredoxin